MGMDEGHAVTIDGTTTTTVGSVDTGGKNRLTDQVNCK
jgi:hypothetical protein